MKISVIFFLLLTCAQIQAQGHRLRCGNSVYGTPPNVLVMIVDCNPAPAPPSPWPIINALAEKPNDWALKRVLYKPALDVHVIHTDHYPNPHFNLQRQLEIPTESH